MSEELDSTHNENVFARRVTDNKIIHISEVERKDTGRGPGYYCLGCKRRLQAVLSTIDNRKKFFRHDAEAVKGQPKCTYSDETYRHKLAKDVLQILKRIKVPNLYKYSTENDILRKYLIKESYYVEANKVLNEVFLYENELGEIEYSRNEELASDKSLVIKPDVLFLDSNDKPILIIEMVATHKPDTKKLVKLKRLGIDAVQVRIPKDSPEAIEQTFRHTNNTFWIYNYEEDNTEPISISNSHPEGISELDKLQRRFFEENFSCRRAQIENLIRQINRLLESEQYREIVERFRSEIRRTAENTDRVEHQLDVRRTEIRDRGIEQHHSRRNKLNARRRKFTEDQREFREYRKDLEERYYSKARKLGFEEISIEYDITDAEIKGSNLDSRGTTAIRNIEEEEKLLDGIRRQIQDLPTSYRDREADIERRITETRKQSVEFGEASRKLQEDIDKSGELLSSKEEVLEREIDSEIRRVETEISRIRREIQDIESEERTFEGTIRRGYPQNREEYIDRTSNGSYEKSSWFNREYDLQWEVDATLKVYCTLEEELTRLEEKNRK